ncbi:MAG: NUDIX domain-containing protein [Acidobacteriota bacterium]
MELQVGVKALIEQDGKYLFLRRDKAFQSGPQKWDIPGGRIKPEEALSDALIREVHEETGLELEQASVLLAAQDIFVPEKSLHVVRLTYSTVAVGSVVLSEEHDDYKWMTRDEALAEPYIDSYLKEVLVERRG